MISIITPCYSTPHNNHGQLVQRAVQSALAQKVDKEIIIVDDGSPIPVINIWGAPVRVIRHERNQGLSAALNTGIKASTGERFIICSSDDELRHDCLEKLSQRNADVVCSDFVGDQGGPIKCRPADLQTLVQAGNCHSYAALIRKSAWLKTNGFKIAMNPSWEDYEQFINLAKTGATWDYVPEALHLYHRNPHGRDVEAQDKLRLLQGKLQGYHPDLFGKGSGLVTFVIPCYKQSQYLADALLSIKRQIYPHVNAVIVDDGSPGNVLKAVNQADKGEVHVVRQRNQHLSAARNTGIRYALENFNSQYLVMLDADDTIHPLFVEEAMGAMGNRQYVYTDIEFIGDAWHHYLLQDYECKLLIKRHIHQCTFLAPAQMWSDIIKARGYAYDEQMKQGYEDWEFALAALQNGWCGKRYPKHYFHYRYHNGGSMRMDATEMNDALVAYVKNKHKWISNQEAVRMACSTCGGHRVSMRQVTNKNGGVALMMSIAGIGQVDGREPLKVTFRGASPETIFTKIGVGGNVYKYSASEHKMVNGAIIGPVFTIFAKDAHLFVGPFVIERINAPQQEVMMSVTPAQPAVVPVEVVKVADPLLAKFEAREQLVVTTLEPDDFTKLKGVGAVGAQRLNEAGFAYFADIAGASVDEIVQVLKTDKKSATAIVSEATTKANA